MVEEVEHVLDLLSLLRQEGSLTCLDDFTGFELLGEGFELGILLLVTSKFVLEGPFETTILVLEGSVIDFDLIECSFET